LEQVDVAFVEAPAEITGGGRIGDAPGAEGVEEVDVVAAQFDVLKTIAVAQSVTASSNDRTIILWDARKGRETARFKDTPICDWICVVFSPDGKTLANSCAFGPIKLWDVATLKELAAVRHGRWAWSIAFSPDGKMLASASEDKTLKIWDVSGIKTVKQ
jgi:WD40 repeat protein